MTSLTLPDLFLLYLDRKKGSGYHIMQIVHSGKLSWFQRPVEIHGKTFAVVSFMQYLLTSFMKLSR